MGYLYTFWTGCKIIVFSPFNRNLAPELIDLRLRFAICTWLIIVVLTGWWIWDIVRSTMNPWTALNPAPINATLSARIALIMVSISGWALNASGATYLSAEDWIKVLFEALQPEWTFILALVIQQQNDWIKMNTRIDVLEGELDKVKNMLILVVQLQNNLIKSRNARISDWEGELVKSNARVANDSKGVLGKVMNTLKLAIQLKDDLIKSNSAMEAELDKDKDMLILAVQLQDDLIESNAMTTDLKGELDNVMAILDRLEGGLENVMATLDRPSPDNTGDGDPQAP